MLRLHLNAHAHLLHHDSPTPLESLQALFVIVQNRRHVPSFQVDDFLVRAGG